MPEWIPPKTNWQAGDIPGASDFNRVESNIAALESGEVMPRGVLLRVVPSDAVILEANTQRKVSGVNEPVPVKEFALKYPGTYRFKCELRLPSVSGDKSVSITVSIS